MSRRLLLAAALALAGCSGAPARPPAPPPPPPAAAPPLPLPPPRPASEIGSPSFELKVEDAIASAFQDTPVILRVYADGKLLGELAPGPRSQPKRFSAKLPDGEHLLRVEVLDAVPGEGGFAFKPWPQERQPAERLIRVAPEELTAVSIKFTDSGRRHELSVERRPR